MKTEHITIEDAEKMAQLTDYAWIAVEEPGSEINWADAGAFYLEGFNAGYEEGQSSPKIKQLEWEEYENLRGRKSYFAKTTFSPYEVADGGDHYTMFSPDKRLRFASADEAKAAAQADFEKRIKECLE